MNNIIYYNSDPDPWHKPDIPRPWDEDEDEEEDCG